MTESADGMEGRKNSLNYRNLNVAANAAVQDKSLQKASTVAAACSRR